MRIIWPLLLPFLLIIPAKSQDNKKLLVTEVNYLRRPGKFVNSETFPFYFHHKEFIKDVHSDIQKHLEKRFGKLNVEFLTPDSIYYTEALIAPATSVRQIAKSKSTIADYYASVETMLGESSEINGVINYSFNTKVKVYNNKGQQLFKFRNKIPFVVTLDESIVGKAEISETDFYTFYLDGLEMAFGGDVQVADKRYIVKPPTNNYDEFLGLSEKFYLQRKGKEYFYGASSQNLQSIYSFSEVVNNEDVVLFFFNDYVVHDKYNVYNNFTGDSMLIKLKTDEVKFESIQDDIGSVIIEAFNKENKEGRFFAVDYSEYAGELLEYEFSVKWNEEFLVHEIFIDDALMFLLYDFNEEQIIHIHRSVNEEQLGQLFNLVFMFDYLQAIIF